MRAKSVPRPCMGHPTCKQLHQRTSDARPVYLSWTHFEARNPKRNPQCRAQATTCTAWNTWGLRAEAMQDGQVHVRDKPTNTSVTEALHAAQATTCTA